MPVFDTVRDAPFGKVVRVLTRQRFFKYDEEKDPEVVKKFLESEDVAEDEKENAELADLDTANPDWGQYSTFSQGIRTTRTQTRTMSSMQGAIAEQRVAAQAALARDIEKQKHEPGLSNVVGWSGPDDPENPTNWSNRKKMAVSIQIWFLTFSIYIGSAIYSPGIPGVNAQFHISSVASTLGLTVFIAGYGLGPMFWSPLSEVPMVGRSPVYVGTLFVFVLFQFPIIYASNLGMLLAFRFLTGFIGSPALAMGAASMGDMWGPRQRDYMIGVWGAFAICAPTLGPLVGGFAYDAKGWTWTMWELMWVSALAWIILFFFLPETFAPNILKRRAKRIRRVTGNNDYVAQVEKDVEGMNVKHLIFESLARPFQLALGEPILTLLNIYTSLIYGIFYIFFECYPIIFEDKHGFNSGEDGLAFLGILVSTIFIAIPGYFIWKYKYQSRHFDENDQMAPEHQLPAACFGAICLPIALFWFGWTGNFASVHWIVPIIASGLFAVGGTLVFNSIFCYEAHAYPQYAASALAGNDWMRSTFAAGFPLFASAMYNNLGVGWASTLLGCLCVVFVPYPFILYKWGKRLRMKSKMARHDI